MYYLIQNSLNNKLRFSTWHSYARVLTPITTLDRYSHRQKDTTLLTYGSIPKLGVVTFT